MRAGRDIPVASPLLPDREGRFDPMTTISSHASATLPVLREEDVRRLVTVEDALATVEAAYASYGRHRQVLSDPPAAAIRPVGVGAVFKLKGAHLPEAGVTGLRIIADRRTSDGEATVDHCWIADARTGAPLGVVSEHWLHRLRTAVTGVVAARHLARPDSRVAVIVGAGAIADEAPAALVASFPIEEIRVVSRRPQSGAAFVERHREKGARRAATSLDDVIDGADIVLGISSAERPVIHARHMAPGRFVCGLGGGAEIAHDCFEAADRFVIDEFAYAAMIGSVKGWIEGGASPATIAAGVYADIGELAAGTKAPGGPAGEKRLAIIQGMAHCDLALAHLALSRAGLAPAASGGGGGIAASGGGVGIAEA